MPYRPSRVNQIQRKGLPNLEPASRLFASRGKNGLGARCLAGLRPSRKDGDSSGFTLLEILLVTFILAMLVGIVTPQFRHSFDNIQFKNFVLNVSTVLRYAHDRALLEKDTYRLKFLEAPSGYQLERAIGKEFHPVLDRSGVFKELPPRVQAEINVPEIILYPDGSATPAEWKFTDAAGHAMTVHVSAESGDIAVEEKDA